jgi:subtilisin
MEHGEYRRLSHLDSLGACAAGVAPNAWVLWTRNLGSNGAPVPPSLILQAFTSHHWQPALRESHLSGPLPSLVAPAWKSFPIETRGETVFHGLTNATWASLPTRVALALLAALVVLSALSFGPAASTLSVAAQEDASRPVEMPADEEVLDGDQVVPTEAPTVTGEEVIVVLEAGVDPLAVARELGVEPTHIYEDVITGFAATVPAAELNAAVASGSIKGVTRDGRVQAEDQIVGTGVLRVGVPHVAGSQNLAIASPVDADIAILDTGVARGSDLNVRGGDSCVDEKQKKDKKKKKKGNKGKGGKGKGKKSNTVESERQGTEKKNKGNKKKNKRENDKSKAWEDDNGHGTNIAGIAAAIDNSQGIVGVAPGARVWAVKVLDENGGGTFSDVICGLNWVIRHRDTIDAVNLSLSGAGSDGPCESSALHQAICNVVYSGVPVVVAAGNQGTNASTRVPASYDEVIAVSGMADSDGAPGHLGPNTCSGQADDTFLPFSNYGADVDIAAPGDCIISLWKDGKLRTQSGTSSASPHVVGAVAFFVQSFTYSNGVRPSLDQVRTWLLTEASRPQNSEFGFSGDPDGTPEPMLWLRAVFGG